MPTFPQTRNNKVGEVRHELDIHNPAEFFASLGVLTAFSLQHREAEIYSYFDISGHQGEHNAAFIVDSDAELSVEKVMQDLANAEVIEERSANVWKNRTENPRLICPVMLSANGWTILLDWWLDELRWKPGYLKLWSGNSSPLEMMRSFIKLGTGFVNAGGTLFGFDTRVSRDAVDVGYSKKDTKERAGAYPLTELLSALGLQQYRPRRAGSRTFAYYAWQKPVPLCITHAAAVQGVPGIGQRLYEFEVQKIGQGAKQAVRAKLATGMTH